METIQEVQERNGVQRAGTEGTRAVHVSGQVQIAKAALKKAKKKLLASKPQDLGGGSGNGYRNSCQIVQKNPEDRFGPRIPVQNLSPLDSTVCLATRVRSTPLKTVSSQELRGGVLLAGCELYAREVQCAS